MKIESLDNRRDLVLNAYAQRLLLFPQHILYTLLVVFQFLLLDGHPTNLLLQVHLQLLKILANLTG